MTKDKQQLLELLRTNWQRIQAAKRSDGPLEFEPIWAIINAVPEVVAKLDNHAEFERDCEFEPLLVENERLREGLRPFAACADNMGERLSDEYQLPTVSLTMGDLRKARTLLGDS